MKITKFDATYAQTLTGGLATGSPTGGDLSGGLPAPTVVGIGGIPVDPPDGVVTDYLDGTGHWSAPVSGGGVSLGSATPLVESGTGAVGSSGNASHDDHVHPAAGGGGGGALILLEQHTASGSASLNFTTCISSTYDEYLIELLNVLPATNDAQLLLRMSTNGGSSYAAGANYGYAAWVFSPTGSAACGASTGQTAIGLSYSGGTIGVSNGSGYGWSGSVRLISPGSAAVYKAVTGTGTYWDAEPSLLNVSASGLYLSLTAVNAFRFLFDSGNIASGTIRVYGIAKV